VTLRITGGADLAGMSTRFREQLAKQMAAAGVRTAVNRKRPRYLEEAAGRQIVAWLDTLFVQDPRLGRICIGEYFAHVPNGGARSALEGAILKGQGVRPGWPDYALHLPRGSWHGLVGELKSDDGAKPDDEQLDILTRLHRAGYCAQVWFGFEDAQKQLLGYLQLGASSR